MAWLEIHQELLHHPKVYRLASALGLSKYDVIGRLFAFWSWALDYADSGDITSFGAGFIADAMGWSGDPQALIDALANCGDEAHAGFIEKLDGKIIIHDWDDYMGRLLEMREKNKERQAKHRRKKKEETENALCNGYVADNSDTSNALRNALRNDNVTEPSNGYVTGLPNQTKPNLTEPNLTQPKDKRPPVAPPSENCPGDIDLTDAEIDALVMLAKMYILCPDYPADPPEEKRFIRELTQDYPGVPLAAEFHKARNWLKDNFDKKRKNLRSFLRNWITKAAKEYKDGKKIVGYRDVVEFVPAEEGSVVNA